MARADFNVRAGKVAWRYTPLAALFFCAWLISGSVPRTSHVEKMPAGNPPAGTVLNFNCPDLRSAVATALPVLAKVAVPAPARRTARAAANEATGETSSAIATMALIADVLVISESPFEIQ